MKKNNGIILILVGIGIFFISIFFSTGASPQRNFFENISRMNIPIYKEYVRDGPPYYTAHVKTNIEIPLKYPISLSVIIILVGSGKVLLSNNKKE